MTGFLNLFGKTPLTRRRAFWGLALVTPNVLGLLFFFGIPVLIAFRTSLQDWNGIRPPVEIGLGNFDRLLHDPSFWNSVGVTLKLMLVVIPAGMLLSLIVALMLNRKLHGRSFFRVVYFLPVVTSTVAATMAWTWMFQPRYGLIANLLEPVGLQDLNWITRPDLVLFPIAAVVIWQRLGFDMILFLAGLQAIPRQLYDAARIDGADGIRMFRFITLPLLSPTTFLVLILQVISAIQIFDQVYVMTARTTRGGMNDSATTLSLFLYETAFTDSELGYSAAVALAMFAITLLLTLVQITFQRRWVYYESGSA